jgi:gamma-glutamyltranspeptidase / glutathione hydrolase
MASPGHVEGEENLGAAVIDELRERGHRITVGEPWTYGRVSAVAREADGVLSGAADARGMQCYTIGR